MSNDQSTIDDQEVGKFAQLSQHWWDSKGPLKTLHEINPVRLAFVNQHLDLRGLIGLDVGCGGGIFTESLAKNGATLTGIDAEAAAIKVATEHAQANGLSIEYLCTPIEDYEHQGFDFISCMEMLEHVQKPEIVLEHCKRLLKPDGLLLVSTISRTFKAYAGAIIMAEYVLGLLPKQTHDYKKFIKPSELTAMARSVGLSPVDLQGMDYNPLTGVACLSSDVSINYLMAFR